MDDKIKRLAEQAGWDMGDEVCGFTTRLERFAELLVQEKDDEIERLRTDKEEILEMLKKAHIWHEKLSALVSTCVVDIERLHQRDGFIAKLDKQIVERDDEIERLREQLKQCIWSETEYCKIIEADNARLRKAVDKMTHHLLQFQPSDDFQHDHMVIVKLKSTDIEEIWNLLPQPPKEKE